MNRVETDYETVEDTDLPPAILKSVWFIGASLLQSAKVSPLSAKFAPVITLLLQLLVKNGCFLQPALRQKKGQNSSDDSPKDFLDH